MGSGGVIFGQAGEITVPITVPLDQLEKALADAKNKVQNATSTLDESMTNLGSFMTKAVSLPIIGAFGAAAKAAIDYETAFTGVRKTVDASEAEFAALSKGLRDLAQEVPQTAVELAGIAEAAGQLGVEKSAILKFTKTIVDLGVSTNLAGEEGASMLAQFATVTQLDQSKFENLGSAIVALGNAGASTEKDILSMGQRIAAAGTIAGLTQGDILGIANAMSSVGIEAEAGGSAISKVLIDIANSAASGGAQLGKYAKVAGMSASQFAKVWKDKPKQAFQQFIAGLGKAIKQGENVFAILEDMEITEVRMRNALLSAATAGDVLANSMDLGNKAFEENIALQSESQKFYDMTSSRLKALWNNINEVAISFGEAFLPQINAAITQGFKFADMLDTAADSVKGMDDTTKAWILGLSGIAVAIGPVLFTVGLIAKSFAAGGAMSMGIKAFAALLNGPVLIGAAAFAGAALLVYQNWDRVAAFLDSIDWTGMWETMQTAANTVWQSIGPIVDKALSGMRARFEGTDWSGMWKNFKESAKSAFAGLSEFGGEQLEKTSTWFSTNTPQIVEALNNIWSVSLMVGKGWLMMVEYCMRLGAEIAKAFGPLGLSIFENFKVVVGGVIDSTLATLDLLIDLLRGDFSEVWQDVKNIVSINLTMIKDLVSNMVSGILESLGNLIPLAKAKAKEAVGAIYDAFYWLADELVLHSVVPDMVDRIGFHFDRMSGLIQGPTREAMEAIVAQFEDGSDAAKKLQRDVDDTAAALNAAIGDRMKANPNESFLSEMAALNERMKAFPILYDPDTLRKRILQMWNEAGLAGVDMFERLMPTVLAFGQTMGEAYEAIGTEVFTTQFVETLKQDQAQVDQIIAESRENQKKQDEEQKKREEEQKKADQERIDRLTDYADMLALSGELIGMFGDKYKKVAAVVQTASRIMRIAISAVNPVLMALQIAIEVVSLAFGLMGDEAEAEASGIEKVFEELEQSLEQWGDQLADSLVEALKSGRLELDKLVDQILTDLLTIGIRATITDPLTNFIGDLFSAKGNAFMGGDHVAFAKGGIVSAPTLFGFGGGKTGVMGEAGDEGILPLERMSNGELGVNANGAGSGLIVQIIDQRGAGAPPIEQVRTRSGIMDVLRLIVRSEGAAALADGEWDGALRMIGASGRI